MRQVALQYVVTLEGRSDFAGRRSYDTEVEALAVAERLLATPDVLAEHPDWTERWMR